MCGVRANVLFPPACLAGPDAMTKRRPIGRRFFTRFRSSPVRSELLDAVKQTIDQWSGEEQNETGNDERPESKRVSAEC